MNRNKVITAEEAVQNIDNGWTLGVEGFVGAGTADDLCYALGQRFQTEGNPSGLTLIHSSGPGDAATRGANRIAHPGMYKRAISGHYGLLPEIGKLALENDFEAYNLPQGILTNFYRAVAGNRPGVLTKVGLGTFADPRIHGGKINEKAIEDIVEVVELGGEEWLFMKSFPVNCVLIRGTTADTRGNITMEREILTVDYLTMTVEPGIIGGMPLGGLDFSASVNGEAVISMPDQFDFYDGGGLDLTCLGFAQCDRTGNVNSSKFGPRIAGCGGFINISQNTKRVLFLGTFTTGGLKVRIEDGKVIIDQEGKIKKVKVLINYNGFRIDEVILKEYIEMAAYIVTTYYERVARHNSSAAARAKFDEEYSSRNLGSNLFATREEAMDYLNG